MFKSIFFSLLFLLVQFSVTAQSIDKEESTVYFKIGNMGINTVKGTFKGFSGGVQFDKNQVEKTRIDVCIDASSIKSGIDKRDEDLKNEEYLYVENFPKICFTSSNITKSEEGFTATGKLRLRDVTKTVEIPLKYEENTLKGGLTINRFDYNIGEDTGSFMMGEEIELLIHCVLK